MTYDEVVSSLTELISDRESFIEKDDPDSIFVHDAEALREALRLLAELAEYRRTGLKAADIQEAVNLLNDTIHPTSLPEELKSWVERCTWHVKRCAELHKEADTLTRELDWKDKAVELAQRKQAEVETALAAAKTDIAALLWLEGRCEYCKFAQKVEYSGASRWTCALGGAAECRPEWRGRCPNDC